MNIGLRNASLRRLAYLAAGFVVLVCTAILVLSTLREWGLRHEALRAAEVDVANVAQSLLQHAEDSFELADSLVLGLVHRLEADGLVHREEYPQIPPKVEYSLTERGRSLIPILDQMCDWGEAHRPDAPDGAKEEGV